MFALFLSYVLVYLITRYSCKFLIAHGVIVLYVTPCPGADALVFIVSYSVSQSHFTIFSQCSLNCAGSCPTDRSWLPCENSEMLNTWHSAAWTGDKETWRERGNSSSTRPQQNKSKACSLLSLENIEGIAAGHMLPAAVTWLWRRQCLDQPVISVPVYNGSLVSCCGGLPSSAASLSTLQSTSFPALPWTQRLLDTEQFFCWARWCFPTKEELAI